MASLADAGVADQAGNVAGGVTFLADPVGVVTDGMTFLERCGVCSGSVFIDADCCDNEPDYFACDEPGAFDICPDMTFLTEPVKRQTRTGLDTVTRLPVLFAHLDRMAPVMETDHPHQDRIARVIPVK